MRNKIPVRKLHVKVRLLRCKVFLNMRFENFQIKLVMNFHLGILNCFEIRRKREKLVEFVSESSKTVARKKIKMFGNLELITFD